MPCCGAAICASPGRPITPDRKATLACSALAAATNPGRRQKSVVVVTNVHNDQVSETAFGTSAMTVPSRLAPSWSGCAADPYDTTQEPSYVVSATGTVRVRVSARATKVPCPREMFAATSVTPGR